MRRYPYQHMHVVPIDRSRVDDHLMRPRDLPQQLPSPSPNHPVFRLVELKRVVSSELRSNASNRGADNCEKEEISQAPRFRSLALGICKPLAFRRPGCDGSGMQDAKPVSHTIWD